MSSEENNKESKFVIERSDIDKIDLDALLGKNKSDAKSTKSTSKTTTNEQSSRSFLLVTHDIYNKAFKKVYKQGTFLAPHDASDAEFCQRAANRFNNVFDDARKEIAKELHQYIKKNGMFTSWYEYQGLMAHTPNDDTLNIHFVFRYFDKDYGSQFEKVDSKYYAKTSMRYHNYYSNDDIEYFDNEFAKMDSAIKLHASNLRKATERLKTAEHEKSLYTIGGCIGSTLWGIVKIVVQLAISGVIALLIMRLVQAFLYSDQITVVAGIIALIVSMIVFWIKYEDDMNFMDWGIRVDKQRAYDSARLSYSAAVSSAKEDESVLNSSVYKEAKARDQKLRDEDMALAKKWHEAWYEFANRSY